MSVSVRLVRLRKCELWRLLHPQHCVGPTNLKSSFFLLYEPRLLVQFHANFLISGRNRPFDWNLKVNLQAVSGELFGWSIGKTVRYSSRWWRWWGITETMLSRILIRWQWRGDLSSNLCTRQTRMVERIVVDGAAKFAYTGACGGITLGRKSEWTHHSEDAATVFDKVESRRRKLYLFDDVFKKQKKNCLLGYCQHLSIAKTLTPLRLFAAAVLVVRAAHTKYHGVNLRFILWKVVKMWELHMKLFNSLKPGCSGWWVDCGLGLAPFFFKINGNYRKYHWK